VALPSFFVRGWPFFQKIHSLHKIVQSYAEYVRKEYGVEIRRIALVMKFGPPDDLSRHTDDDGIFGHRPDHDSIRADAGVVAYDDVAEYLGPGPYSDPVSDGGMPFALLQGSPPERHTVVHRHIFADDRGLSDHDACAVIDEEALPYRCARMNLDARQQSGDMGEKACGEFRSAHPHAVRHPVRPDGMEPRIDERDLRMRSGRWIACEH